MDNRRKPPIVDGELWEQETDYRSSVSPESSVHGSKVCSSAIKGKSEIIGCKVSGSEAINWRGVVSYATDSSVRGVAVSSEIGKSRIGDAVVVESILSDCTVGNGVFVAEASLEGIDIPDGYRLGCGIGFVTVKGAPGALNPSGRLRVVASAGFGFDGGRINIAILEDSAGDLFLAVASVKAVLVRGRRYRRIDGGLVSAVREGYEGLVRRASEEWAYSQEYARISKAVLPRAWSVAMAVLKAIRHGG